MKLKLTHVKKFGKISRKIKNFPAKTIKILPVKIIFFPVKKVKKKNEKMKKCP